MICFSLTHGLHKLCIRQHLLWHPASGSMDNSVGLMVGRFTILVWTEISLNRWMYWWESLYRNVFHSEWSLMTGWGSSDVSSSAGISKSEAVGHRIHFWQNSQKFTWTEYEEEYNVALESWKLPWAFSLSFCFYYYQVHKKDLVIVKKIYCFVDKKVFLLPQTSLENVQKSH